MADAILCEICKLPIKHPRPGSKKHVHLECRDRAYWIHCVGRQWEWKRQS